MKRLILTADDFGYSSQVNSAVAAAYERGVLRYASLMVKRPGALEAAELSRRHPGLGVGLHVELCAESPALWGLRYAFSAKDKQGLEADIRGQIEALLELGVKPTHVDGHFNIHVHPVIFPLLARLAREYRIPRIRLPSGELGPSTGFSKEGLPSRLVLSGVFGALAAALRGSAAGLEVPRTYGLLRSGLMTEDYLVWLAGRLPQGLTEIYLHPSSDPQSAVRGRPTATHQSVTELETLLSPRLRSALERAGVSLEAEPAAPRADAGDR